MSAAKNPNKNGKKFVVESASNSPLRMSLAILPSIKGITIKNENSADFFLSIPSNTDMAIVDPLLEIPGKMAMAWAIPINKESINPTFLAVDFALSARYKSSAVIMSI